jgi:hypothetical protein
MSQTVDLLTDPRLTDDCYLFFDDNPFSAPPAEMDTVGDINTGLAYRATYDKLIAPEPFTAAGRRKVLLPYVFYLDGTVVGRMNQNMSLEIMKFTLGIFNGKVRTKAWAWRHLGNMKRLVEARRPAEENIRGSGHIDSQLILPRQGHKFKHAVQDERPTPAFNHAIYKEEGDCKKRKRVPVVPTRDPSQDFHKMLQVIMASYKDFRMPEGLNGITVRTTRCIVYNISPS